MSEIALNEKKYHGYQKTKEIAPPVSFLVNKEGEEKKAGIQEQEIKKTLKQLKQRFGALNLNSDNLILILKNCKSQADSVNFLDKQLKNQGLESHDRQEIMMGLLPYIKTFFKSSRPENELKKVEVFFNAKNDHIMPEKSKIGKDTKTEKTDTEPNLFKVTNNLLHSILDLSNASSVSDIVGPPPEKLKQVIKNACHELNTVESNFDTNFKKDLGNFLSHLTTLHTNLSTLQKAPTIFVDKKQNDDHHSINKPNDYLNFEDTMIAVFLDYQQNFINNMSSQNQQNKDNVEHQKVLMCYQHEKLVELLNKQLEEIKKNESRSWWDRLIDSVVNVVQIVIGVVEMYIGDEISGAANIAAGVCGLAKDFCEILKACHIGNQKALDKAITVLSYASYALQLIALATDIFSVVYKPAKFLKDSALKLIKKGGGESLTHLAEAGSVKLAKAAKEGKQALKVAKKELEKQFEKETRKILEEFSEKFSLNSEEAIEMKNMASAKEELALEEFDVVKPESLSKAAQRGIKYLEKPKVIEDIVKKSAENMVKKVERALKQAQKTGREIEFSQKEINEIIPRLLYSRAKRMGLTSFRYILPHKVLVPLMQSGLQTFNAVVDKYLTELIYEQDQASAKREMSKNEADNTQKRIRINEENQKNEIKPFEEAQKSMMKFLQQWG